MTLEDGHSCPSTFVGCTGSGKSAQPPSAHRRDLPPAADILFRAMVQKEPDRRYADAADLVADLERLEAGQPPAGPRRKSGASSTRLRRPFPRGPGRARK